MDVKSIQILGNTLVETDTLHGLVADAEGKTLTLDQLDEMATRISRYYRGRGQSFARAVVPAQVIQSGMVRFLVIEARYGKVGIDNHTRVNDLLLQATAAPLQGGQPVEQALLDKSLLLMSDIPGRDGAGDLEARRRAGKLRPGHPGHARPGGLRKPDAGRLRQQLHRKGPARRHGVFQQPLAAWRCPGRERLEFRHAG